MRDTQVEDLEEELAAVRDELDRALTHTQENSHILEQVLLGTLWRLC